MTTPSALTPGPDHAGPPPSWPARARKFLVAVAGFAGEAVAAGLLHGDAERWTVAALGALTLAGIYRVPNAQAKPST